MGEWFGKVNFIAIAFIFYLRLLFLVALPKTMSGITGSAFNLASLF